MKGRSTQDSQGKPDRRVFSRNEVSKWIFKGELLFAKMAASSSQTSRVSHQEVESSSPPIKTWLALGPLLSTECAGRNSVPVLSLGFRGQGTSLLCLLYLQSPRHIQRSLQERDAGLHPHPHPQPQVADMWVFPSRTFLPWPSFQLNAVTGVWLQVTLHGIEESNKATALA